MSNNADLPNKNDMHTHIHVPLAVCMILITVQKLFFKVSE